MPNDQFLMKKKASHNHLAFSIQHSAFTLIELLVVISIIGILAGVALVSFTGAQRQARDSQRKSDIKQYQTLLETYAGSNNNLYPSWTVDTRPDTLCPAPLGPTSCPRDPSSTTYEYYYRSDGLGSPANNATQYVLWAYQENSTNYFIVCSNGRTGSAAAAPASANCPI